MKNTRNMFRLLAAIAAIAALDASARAQTLDKLQFRLNWTLYGEHAPFFVALDKGLGYLLLVTNSNMETALMFATLVGLTFIGLVFFYSVEFLESLLIPWHVTHRIREESGTM